MEAPNRVEIMKYIFINPVVDKLHEKRKLNELLLQKGYQRVEVKTDWHGIVKEKYNELLKDTNLTIIDRRCPKTIEMVSAYIDDASVLAHSIEPILIHCAIELSEREDLKDRKKIITTPCESLASYGNKIGLKDTEFISWKTFLKLIDSDRKLQVRSLEASPIPPGYFESLNAKASSISGKEMIEDYFKKNLHKQYELVEVLYCYNGCHNGDGVLIDE